MSDPLAALAQIAGGAWLVGGAVRDRLLGRRTADFDVAVPGGAGELARQLGAAAGAFAFELSREFGAWRVVAHDRSWQLDLIPLGGATIEDDLSRRDLTINAIAAPISGGDYIDPFGGRADLERRQLRMVAPDAFRRDPLRTLRLARLACELGFAVDPATAGAARASAPALAQVAPERIFVELARVVCADDALGGLALMDAAGVTEAILPELGALRGVEQNRFHHLDVLDHTRAVLAETIALERDPGLVCAGDEIAGEVRRWLAQPLANELTRGQALRFGAVLENVVLDEDRDVDFTDTRITENTRGAYPIEFIHNAKVPCTAGHPTDVIFLTCDAFGVLPPVSALSPAHAMYHFISGYTAKVAGTEIGVNEPQATFSPCFGGPFLVWHPSKYAELLAENMRKHSARVWLVNTGWGGGTYGVGKRISLKNTRAIIDAIYSGTLASAKTERDPIFGFDIVTECSGVPAEILRPRDSWADKAAYDATAIELAGLFNKNFETYAGGARAEVKAAAPAA